ncbi:GlxA family transcriptional regulator [Streptomyces sp. NBC_00193]|uniref:GlxA family transcriptional regulator n=1 Tax=unclassified Streptomyces TaxID=2593676 RepID=UPI002257ABC8|nr:MULTISPECIES: GlxA family transcriptional regulator [unclassified Streptomyces]MCX5124461.1 GlxA family transcriptional regulator [Streptomyces sp. NBC_00347]MCX5297706.1 GlxA family transcriptional regulator [Streptomyces sp. NBC_00193]
MGRVAARPAPHSIVVVAFDGVQLLDVTGPAEVFSTANVHGARYEVRIVSPDGADVRTSSGVRIGADGGPDGLPARPGTLVVPGRSDWRRAVSDPALTGLVAELVRRSRRVTSVCAGAFVLAETGVLDGRRAVTHWRLAAQLAAAYPRVRVEADPVFVRDGHVVTSAGVTSGIDLALSLVEEDHGAAIAREVARELVVFMARPGGQSQYSARLTPREAKHPVLRAVMDSIGADPRLSLDEASRDAGVSGRHLARLFRAETGMTPGQYLESVRLEAAQGLLEAGDDPVDAVAAQSGFGSAETMRRVFQQSLGVAPTAYRARFRSTRTSPSSGSPISTNSSGSAVVPASSHTSEAPRPHSGTARTTPAR